MLTFAKSHDAKVVAVGVEDESAAVALATLGFDAGQGNALGRAALLGDPDANEPSDVAETSSTPEEAPKEHPTAQETVDSSDEPLDLSAAEEKSQDEDRTKKARIDAVKRAALRRFRAAQSVRGDVKSTKTRALQEAEERAAAEAAETTARQLQARLEHNFSVPATDTPAPNEPVAQPVADAPNVPPEPPVDPATLAQIAAAFSTADYSKGLQIEGYEDTLEATGTDGELSPTTGTTSTDAMSLGKATTSAPSIRSLLDLLPTDIAARKGPPAEADIEKPADEIVEDFAEPADMLDEVVEALPEVPHEEDPTVPLAVDLPPLEEVAVGAVAPRNARHGGPSRMPTFLTRKYKITHFWPRSWQRAARRWKASRASQSVETADAA